MRLCRNKESELVNEKLSKQSNHSSLVRDRRCSIADSGCCGWNINWNGGDEMRFVTLQLPIPDAKLSPNARIYWRKKAPITKIHRRIAKYRTQAQKWYRSGLVFKSYRLTFYWRFKRVRDRDNASARCKAYLDGVSDAIGQDDSEWDFNGVKFEYDKENPRLEIEFEVK